MDGGALHDKVMALSLLSPSCFNGGDGLLFRTDVGPMMFVDGESWSQPDRRAS